MKLQPERVIPVILFLVSPQFFHVLMEKSFLKPGIQRGFYPIQYSLKA
jgi:hypothetical protein